MTGPGRVALVGAGPGAPDLITLRGLARLREADVVIYDRLIPVSLLAECPPGAERVCAARPPGRRRMEQHEIDALMIARARAGKRVVRLKGGDPCLFGRSGEEALALVRANVPFEIVPGVTSATAAPAAAGIPITHRGIAGTVTIYSAKGDPEDTNRMTARASTYLVMMGLATLPAVVDELRGEGVAATTPAAMISAGTTGKQRVVYGSLGDMAPRVAAAKLETPAILVVGEVVALAAELAPGAAAPAAQAQVQATPRAPLAGLRVALLSSEVRGSLLAEMFAVAGAECIALPGEGLDGERFRAQSCDTIRDLVEEGMVDAVVCATDAAKAAIAEAINCARASHGNIGRDDRDVPIIVAPADPEDAIRALVQARAR